MLISETENNTALVVSAIGAPLFGLRDEDGEVFFDREQAAQLILVLQHIVRTGELPK